MNIIKADRYLLNNTTEKSFIWSSSNKDKLINKFDYICYNQITEKIKNRIIVLLSTKQL